MSCTIVAVQLSSPLSAGNTTSTLISSCRQRHLMGGRLSPFIRQLEPPRSLRTEEHGHLPTGMPLASSRLHLPFSFFNLSWSEVAQSCPTLCDPMDCSPPGSSVHGIFQARVLEWVAIAFSRGPSGPRDRAPVSCITGRHFTVRAPGKPLSSLCILSAQGKDLKTQALSIF